MPYIQTKVVTPNAIFIHKHNSARYGKKGKRGERIGPTSEQQKEINKRISSQKWLWTICQWFRSTDYYLTFTYRKSDRPDSIKEASRIAGTVMGKLRRILKSRGKKLSYVLVTERGERGAVHHHVLIKNNFNIGIFFEKGLWSYGGVRYDPEEMKRKKIIQLAKYFIKGDSDKSEKVFSKSRDLVAPKPQVKIIPAEGWREKPIIKKGYELWNYDDGIECERGTFYQGYIMVKRE